MIAAILSGGHCILLSRKEGRCLPPPPRSKPENMKPDCAAPNVDTVKLNESVTMLPDWAVQFTSSDNLEVSKKKAVWKSWGG